LKDLVIAENNVIDQHELGFQKTLDQAAYFYNIPLDEGKFDVDKACLTSEKASSHVAVHKKFSTFFLSLRIDLILSANLEMNLAKDVSLPTSRCTSFRSCGLLIFSKA